MSHITAKKAYQNLQERINRFPQGAPPSESLYKILAILFSEKEAQLVAQLPIKPFTIKTASQIWKKDLSETQKILDELASRCVLLDMEQKGETHYVLPPPMAGFFEFSLMRLRGDINQKVLAELYYQYLNVEDDFVKELFTGTETNFVRTFVNEEALGPEEMTQILDYEKATEVIETATHIGLSMCYCRHKMSHIGKACSAPMDICMTFNSTAASLIKHDYAKKIDKSECMDLLHQAYEKNLIQSGENVQNNVSFICNCCGCCCEALLAAKKFGNLHPVQTSSFLPVLNESACHGCGKCKKVCPIEVIRLEKKEKGMIALIDQNLCLGCGVCVRNCPTKALTLQQRKKRVITPVNSVHRSALMAIEKGKLQELIFDNQALFSHRAMNAILGAILKLSPIKKALASEQMKSRYLAKLLEKY